MGGIIDGVKNLLGKKQDFLEAEPYWDQSTIPVNTYKNKAPFTGKIVSTKRIVGPEATGETCDIVIGHEGKMPYWEGQSYGVIPPGTNPKNGKPVTRRGLLGAYAGRLCMRPARRGIPRRHSLCALAAPRGCVHL